MKQDLLMNVFLIAAITVDGFIAQSPDQISTSWTSGDDMKWFVKRTKDSGVMIIGRKTYETMNRSLVGRVRVVMTRDKNPKVNTNYNEVGFKADLQSIGEYTEVVKSKGEVVFSGESPKGILKELEKKGFTDVAICGGSSIYSLFLKENLVNKLYLTVEPVLFGKGISLLNNNVDAKLKLISEEKLNEAGTRLLEYELI